MSSSRPHEEFWRDLKCASCYRILENPIQLPACFHILCLNCEMNLEANYDHNICCPKCGKENAKPSILYQISGVEQPSRESLLCDVSLEHDAAKWNCFECGLNLCGSCRVSHAKDHNIKLIAHPESLRNRILENHGSGNAQAAGVLSLDGDQINKFCDSKIECPICDKTNCHHVQLLQKMFDSVSPCQQEGHVDTELKYFCKDCWVPVCGDCSHKGNHKLHECDDMSTCGKEYAFKSLAIWKEKLHMLIERSKQDVTEAKKVKERLHQHVDDTDRELNSRKLKILEETKDAFDKAITAAGLQGQNILMDYREKLCIFEKFESFLQKVEEVVTSFTLDKHQPQMEQYVRAFYQQKLAAELIPQIYMEYQKLERLAERQLVLPELEAETTPPHCLARVGTEWKQLKLAFSFKLDDEYLLKSIVLTDSNTCLLSTKRYSSHYDSIVQCRYNKRSCLAELTVYDTGPGEYFISQLKSGEILASYTCPTTDPNDPSHHLNYVGYCSRLPEHNSSLINFQAIKKFEFPPYSIAATQDNNILLCVNADQKKGVSYLMLLNLLGEELKSTVKQGSNMITPNYIAVSDSGEICVSDTEGSSIVILDEDLDIKERMNYQLPTSMRDSDMYQFQPHGVCFDSYGRIIVADPHNSCVLRLLRAPGSNKYKLEPLLTENCEIAGFRHPNLVAMGKDSRLWVVCAEHVFVFNYCA